MEYIRVYRIRRGNGSLSKRQRACKGPLAYKPPKFLKMDPKTFHGIGEHGNCFA